MQAFWMQKKNHFRNFHQDVSRFTVHKGLRPNSRIMYRFFTSHQPMMNEQDQVTWTNWPASKKKDHIDHSASNRNVHSSFESQTSHSGKPNGVLDHSLCRKVFNWSPNLVMKWFDVVVCNHEAYASQGMARKRFFFMFSSPVPFVPAFLIVEES